MSCRIDYVVRNIETRHENGEYIFSFFTYDSAMVFADNITVEFGKVMDRRKKPLKYDIEYIESLGKYIVIFNMTEMRSRSGYTGYKLRSRQLYYA